MATRRRTTTRKRTTAPRRRRTTRAAAPVRRTRRVSRKRSMLSEFFDPKSAQAAAMVSLEGAAGGVGAHFLGKILPGNLSAQNKGIITLGAGFVTAAMFKRPNLGAGMAAVGAVDLLRGVGFLAEEGNMFDYAGGMDSLPMVLNEGEAYALAEGYDLAEGFDLAEGEYSESSGQDYMVGYYPEFGL
jgi:hypothetical protein